jgi:methylated-DNA-[protein]-cysteine S-methyltransferase
MSAAASEIIAKTYYDTPVGPVELSASEQGVRSLCFVEFPTYEIEPQHPFLLEAIGQLDEYFAGERTHFTVFLDLVGTPFQQRVWRQLRDIPLGHTQTYGEVAKALASPDATRAVGNACSRNQHWLLVPCHRVIGADGQLTGYAGGLKRKRWLLHHEWGMLHGRQGSLFE